MKQSAKSLISFLALSLVLASPAEAMPFGKELKKFGAKFDKEADRLKEQAEREARRIEEQLKIEAERIRAKAEELLKQTTRIKDAQKRLDDLEVNVAALTGTAAPTLGGAGEPSAEDLSDARLAAIEARMAALTTILEELASRPATAAPAASAPPHDGNTAKDAAAIANQASLLASYAHKDPIPTTASASSHFVAADPATLSLSSMAPAPVTVTPDVQALLDSQASQIAELRAALAARDTAPASTTTPEELATATGAPLPAPGRAAPTEDERYPHG
jgi:hypothetical protein